MEYMDKEKFFKTKAQQKSEQNILKTVEERTNKELEKIELDNIKKISPEEKVEDVTEGNILESEELLEKIQTTDKQIQSFIRGINYGSKKTTEEIQGQIDLADSVLLELKSIESSKKEGLIKSLENRKTKLSEKLEEQSEKEDKVNLESVKDNIDNTKEDDEKKENKEAENKNTFGELIVRMRDNAGKYGEISEDITEKIMELNEEIKIIDEKEDLEEKDKERLQKLKIKRKALVEKQEVSDGSLALEASRIELMEIVAGGKGDVLKATLAFRESFAIIKQGLQGEIDEEINNLPEPKKEIVKAIVEGETKIVIEKGEVAKSFTIEEQDRDPASFYKTESEKTRITKNVKIKKEALETLRKNSLDINDALTADTIINIVDKCGKTIDKEQIKSIDIKDQKIIVNLLDNSKKLRLIIDLSKIDRYHKNTLAKKEAGWRKFIGGQKFGIDVILEKEASELNNQNPTIANPEETIEKFQEPEIAPIDKTEKSEETEWVSVDDMAQVEKPGDTETNKKQENGEKTEKEIDTKKEVIGTAFGRKIFKQEETNGLRIFEAGKKLYDGIFGEQTPDNEKEMIGKISKDNAIKIRNNFLTKDILNRFSAIWMTEHNIDPFSKDNSVESFLEVAAKKNNKEGRNKNFLEFIQEAFKGDRTNNQVPVISDKFEKLAGRPASDFTIGEVLDIIEKVKEE